MTRRRERRAPRRMMGKGKKGRRMPKRKIDPKARTPKERGKLQAPARKSWNVILLPRPRRASKRFPLIPWTQGQGRSTQKRCTARFMNCYWKWSTRCPWPLKT
uniref:Uncharacterized protein n=1 Tax=Ciona savignyi TaxID=51511 RepID=H2ZE99_CIOSA